VFPVNIIHAKAEQLGLKYLVIGGHAVNAYGEPRTTIDVDFLISKETRQSWSNLLQAEGFKEANDGGTFVQFSPPYGTEWNLDLMLVNHETFAKLHGAARQAVMLGITTLVPCAEHLVGLKLHAMKFGPARRQDKDLLDVLTLIENANLDPRSEAFKKLIEQFGTAEIYERILRAQATRGS
jgi:hypothetical protein